LLLNAIASRRSRLELRGVDLSLEMARVAREALGTSAQVIVGDAEALPFRDAAFDIVACVDSFLHYPNPGEVLAEIARVMKPRGRVILADPWAPTPWRQLTNGILPLVRRGDVRRYGQEEMAMLLADADLAAAHWTRLGWTACLVVADPQ